MKNKTFYLVGLLAAVVLAFFAGLFWDDISLNTNTSTPPKKQSVTYYQWNDENGEVIVSRQKPKGIDNFISFQSTENLENYSYDIDPDVLAQAQKYHDSFNEKEDDTQTSGIEGEGIKAIDKTKECVSMVSEIQELRMKQIEGSDPKAQKRLAELQGSVQEVCGR